MVLTLLAVLYLLLTKRTKLNIQVYQPLYEYLVLQKSLSLPGIGTFVVERKPADFDFANKQINPPSYSISFKNGDETEPSKKLFNWLANALHTTELDAVMQFNQFNAELRNKLYTGAKLDWKGIGHLSKSPGGDIVLEAASPIAEGPAIIANRVIREKAEHYVRVGEQEKTSDEMRELLSTTVVKRKNWLIAAVTILVLSIAFIAYYLYSHGFSVGSIGNQQKLLIK